MRSTKARGGIIILIATLAVSTGMLFVVPTTANAMTFEIVPECAKIKKASDAAPDLNCALQVFDNVAKLILGITGSFALLMFVYGGFMMLTSGGKQESVSKGKTIITNAVIGIIIILTSGYLIDYGVNKVTSGAKVEGTTCTAGGASGVWMLIGGRTEVQCITQCSALGTDYACLDVTKRTDESIGCIPDLCPSGYNIQCCPK